ncbi:7-cyano-7-deazaguanine synthase [bacterium]|nr:7-cyano-7-deazaguanine synthase [bacterium]MBU1990141.1 7-cyano-7-deazaguanine synthase [bacterium]
MKKIAVISHSGGLDSTTLLAYKLDQGYHVLPINVNYGQRNVVEMVCQKNIIDYYKKKYPNQLQDTTVIDLSSTFKSFEEKVEDFRNNGFNNKNLEELNFYFPNRNMLFFALAGVFGEVYALAEDLERVELCLGIHKHTTYKEYWDIKPEFANAMKIVFGLNDAITVEVDAPFVDFTKEKIIETTKNLNVPYKLTWTCYEPQEKEQNLFVPCNKCDACIERQEFAVNTIPDINEYFVEIHN